MSRRAVFWLEILASAALIASPLFLLPMATSVIVAVVAGYWIARTHKPVKKPE